MSCQCCSCQNHRKLMARLDEIYGNVDAEEQFQKDIADYRKKVDKAAMYVALGFFVLLACYVGYRLW